MTRADRVRRALEGEALMPRPSVIWSASPGHQADVVLTDLPNLESAIATHPDQIVLCEVLNPMGRALRLDIPLNSRLQSDPAEGEVILAELVDATRTEIVNALESGAHGIFYRLDGAYPSATTPMQYGGHYLELDREILEGINAPVANLLYVEGGGDIYLDFVADLPCDIISWDSARADVNFHSIRPMCRGKIALDHPEADFFFATSYDEIERLYKRVAAS